MTAVRRLAPKAPCWCGSGDRLKRCHGQRRSATRPPVRPGTPSPPATVPATIARPPYLATGGWPDDDAATELLAGAALDGLRHAGRVAAEVLAETGAAVAPGVTTAELDAIARQAYLARGAYPSTLGYRGFAHSICTSVNEVACHGIPDDRPLLEGDIVNVDVTAFVDGFHGDTSATYAVGRIAPELAALVAVTEEATAAGVAAIRAGGETNDIGRAIEAVAHPKGYGIVTRYGGHGIGRVFHGFHVHHTDVPWDSVPLRPGLAFTVEPMLTIGSTDLETWPDGWTEVTVDRLPSAQFEHTVVVTEDGPEIVTSPVEGGGQA